MSDPDDNRGPSMLGFLLFCTSVGLTAGTIIWIFWKAVVL